jgi:hypothetical protein
MMNNLDTKTTKSCWLINLKKIKINIYVPKKISELKKKKNPTADVKIWKIQLINYSTVCLPNVLRGTTVITI